MDTRLARSPDVSWATGRNKVLRNTYALLGLSMIPTVLGAWIGVQTHFSFFAGSPVISMMLFLGISFGFFYGIERYKNSSAGVALLLAFTFFMGLMLSRLVGMVLGFSNGATLITMAGGGTALAFFGLSAVAASTKRDLSGLAKFLSIGSILVLGALILNIFFQVPALLLTILIVLLGLSCAWLVHDVNRVVTGGETNYITATLAIYIDLFNIFQTLLSLLGIFGGNRD